MEAQSCSGVKFSWGKLQAWRSGFNTFSGQFSGQTEKCGPWYLEDVTLEVKLLQHGPWRSCFLSILVSDSNPSSKEKWQATPDVYLWICSPLSPKEAHLPPICDLSQQRCRWHIPYDRHAELKCSLRPFPPIPRHQESEQTFSHMTRDLSLSQICKREAPLYPASLKLEPPPTCHQPIPIYNCCDKYLTSKDSLWQSPLWNPNLRFYRVREEKSGKFQA